MFEYRVLCGPYFPMFTRSRVAKHQELKLKHHAIELMKKLKGPTSFPRSKGAVVGADMPLFHFSTDFRIFLMKCQNIFESSSYISSEDSLIGDEDQPIHV